jgi:hypothetical protein
MAVRRAYPRFTLRTAVRCGQSLRWDRPASGEVYLFHGPGSAFRVPATAEPGPRTLERGTWVAPLIAFLLAAASVAPAAQLGAAWHAAPEYLALFAPSGPRRDAYETFVSSLDLEAVLERLENESGVLAAPGAWQSRPQLPFDAFGQTGRYDRWKLAELYGARRAYVARGPRGDGTRVTEVWTLVSPYPDPTLSRLEPGTLLIVLRVP